MTVQAFESAAPDLVRLGGSVRHLSFATGVIGSRRKPKLAIVSTFDDLCGIAGYTRALLPQLEPHFDVEVFDLDQFFMRSTHRRVRKLADKMVREFCDRAGDFDFVNIQLEHGTLGRNNLDIVRRFGMIARSAPALSVTFHTVLPQEPFSEVTRLLGHLVHFRWQEAARIVQIFRSPHFLNRRIYRLLRTLQRLKRVNIIVHTRRDLRLMRYVNGFKSVYDHPLAFISAAAAQQLRTKAEGRQIAGLSTLPPGAKVVGVFGFLSEYKGIDTVIKAMHKLPDVHHLLIFGGLHPNEIKKGVKLHPYVDRLLSEAKVGTTVLDGIDNKSVVLQFDRDSHRLLSTHPDDIGSRIHFLGPQTDEGFAAHMALCDHVVLPYLEVGQSSSGVLSIAVEMGCRVIAARNHAFMQYARYHPDCIELFEIGNYLELAEKIRAEPAYPARARKLAYTVETNAEMYRVANTVSSWRERRAVPALRERAAAQI